MQPVQVSTVIVGSWNPRIFTPSWIKTNLFGLTDGQEIQGMVNFEEMDFGFQHQGVLLFARPNLVEVNFDGYERKKAELASTAVIRILELLPQTPIKALGVNIRYILNRKDTSPLVTAINNTQCTFGEFQLNQIKQTSERKNYQINIISDIFKDSIQANFNFHYSKIAPFEPNFINVHFEETQKILKNGN
ncbi:MAG: hypothetical protein ACK514_01020 [Bacteroidota bacterium]|jgi:hypothetical protein|nr:hypothetical protein [Cytophagales bacterium]MCE2958296.1 hypothetical protein [Flammeovirgaceae bacterium]MCZ8070959.1 hypothetical protein [Cytophagales bacterium]